jgi:hypothetical protein
MDESAIREHVQKHADAVVRGEMNVVAADFSEELRPQLPEIAKALPQPVTSASVLSLEVGEPTSVATIRYDGDADGVTIRSHSQDLGGPHPVIVQAEPA